MQADNWLLLTDYASKYRVSVSTLRRRIKGHSIQFRFDSGKYFLFDSPPQSIEEAIHEPQMLRFPGLGPIGLEAAPFTEQAEENLNELRKARLSQNAKTEIVKTEPFSSSFSAGTIVGDKPVEKEEPIISTATRLLNELKRAYMSILQEKEEQIVQLKEEVSDLKTLVRVLEDDNDRMRRFLNPHGLA